MLNSMRSVKRNVPGSFRQCTPLDNIPAQNLTEMHQKYVVSASIARLVEPQGSSTIPFDDGQFLGQEPHYLLHARSDIGDFVSLNSNAR